ncbi:hypothetical protein GCM10009527_048030 [Actinomadura nitritigenes]
MPVAVPQDPRERVVDGLPLGEQGALVDGGAHQRMPEPDRPAGDHDQPAALGLGEGGGGRDEESGRVHHRAEGSGVVRRDDEQQRPRRVAEPVGLPPERALQPLGDRQRARPPRLAGARRPRQLQQGERVAAGGAEHPVPQPRGQPGRLPVHQGRGRLGGQPAEAQDGEVGGGQRPVGRPAAPGRHQQRDRVVLDPARREPHRLDGRDVGALAVVDHAEQRAFGRQLRQEGEGGEPGEERVDAGGGLHSERRAQRRGLRVRQQADPVGDGPEQQVQGRVGQFRLALGARDAQHPHAGRRALHRLLQQRRLADPRVADDDQRPARARAGAVDEPFDGP